MIPKILVIGDVIIDHYIVGEVTRQSPEADVPVLSNFRDYYKVGGAGNVALGLQKLGADVHLCGVINTFIANSLKDVHLVKSEMGAVTIKNRLMAGNKHLARFDGDVINAHDFTKNLKGLHQYDLIILSDYAKGVVTKEVAQATIKSGVKVIVDPKGKDYSKYNGAFLIKPNEREFTEAGNATEYSQHTLVTCADKGMVLGYDTFEATNKTPIDVTGAGDTVLAALSYFVSIGEDLSTACKYASIAAGISVGHIGNYNPTLKEIMEWK